MKRFHWRFFPFFLFFLVTIFLCRGLFLKPQILPSAQIGISLPAFSLPVLGQAGTRLTAETLKGQIAVLNIWASWCEACSEEQVFLMQLAEGSIPVYGINYKDRSKKAQKWLAEWGNPYRLIGEDRSGKTAIDLGVYGAPETFLIDKQGIIRFRQVGILTEQIWQREFMPRIKALQEAS